MTTPTGPLIATLRVCPNLYRRHLQEQEYLPLLLQRATFHITARNCEWKIEELAESRFDEDFEYVLPPELVGSDHMLYGMLHTAIDAFRRLEAGQWRPTFTAFYRDSIIPAPQ